jgi:hypothetical protein
MPMEQLGIVPFNRAMFQSRNSEAALLVALNSCARITKQVSSVENVGWSLFGSWFKRVQGQRIGPESALVAQCVSFIDLSMHIVFISDFYGADFNSSVLRGLDASFSCFQGANLEEANLEGTYLEGIMSPETIKFLRDAKKVGT